MRQHVVSGFSRTDGTTPDAGRVFEVVATDLVTVAMSALLHAAERPSRTDSTRARDVELLRVTGSGGVECVVRDQRTGAPIHQVIPDGSITPALR